tara:strand:+ start:1122 stop:3125 length:2004 start_codon:yes stop_codon:yes gene_type:complete
MALIIPKSVGGTADFTKPPAPVKPVEERASKLIIPSSVGGAMEEPAVIPAKVPNASTLQEIGAAPELNELSIPSFLASAGALFSFDDAEVGGILQTQFPGTKITPDDKGDLVATFPSGENFAINKSGFSGQDLIKIIGSVAAFTTAGRMAAIPATLGKKVAVGSLASAGTQAGIEAGQSAIGGDFDKSEVALAGALGGAAELVMPAIQGIRQARQTGELGASARELKQVAPSIAKADEAVAATGVPLFQAQKTLVPSQLEKQSFIASLPAGTLKASKELKSQNKAAGQAVDDFLGLIAPPESVVTGAEKFRSAAQRAIGRAKEIRAEKSSPLFKEAFDEGLSLDTSGIVASLKTTLNDFPEQGEVARTLSKVSQMLTPKVEGAPQSLRQLQNIKVEIDQMINKVGEGSLGNTTKANLVQVKNQLLDNMDQVSPVFKEARETFARNSAPIGALEDSIIGKIASIKDVDLKSISSKMFNPAESNPAVVAKAKAIITDVDPDAWNQLVRVELERRLGSIKPAEGETLQNIPGQLYRAIFGNDKQSKVLYQALDAEQSKNLKYIQTALGRARIGRPGGSQTAAREEIKKELSGGAVKSIREFFSSPIKTVTDIGDDAAFNSRVSALAETMYNPRWSPKMKAIRKLSPDSPAAARAMAQLLDDITLEQKEDK